MNIAVSVKRLVSTVIVLGLVLMMASSAFAAGKTLEKFSGFVFDAFDTTTTVVAYCESASVFSDIMAEIESDLNYYHKLFDIYNSYEGMTNMCDVNKHAAEAPVEVPQEIIDMLVFSKEMNYATEGHVNVAFGAVLRIWHEIREYNNAFPDTPLLPSMDDLKAANEHCNIDDLIIDEENRTVFFADPDLKLDVGSIGKGYAVELTAKKLIAEGHDHILLNAGGNVRAIGMKPEGNEWIIGISNPDTTSPDIYIAKVHVDNKAVITSGVYQRFFMYNGERYHHIIDRDTLRPEDRYLSVSLVLDDSGYGDALSTAIFNMEYEDGLAFVEALDGVEAMWILADGTEYFSTGFLDYWVD